MGNLGTPEIFVVLIIALLVLGPNRLPSAARQMGKAMAEFRRVTSGLQAEMQNAVSSLENEVKKATDDSPVDSAAIAPPIESAPYVFEPPTVGPNPDLLPPAEPEVAPGAEAPVEPVIEAELEVPPASDAMPEIELTPELPSSEA